MPIKPEILVHP